MESILSWVKNGLLFGLFASVIRMISPGKTYRVQIGMVTGLLFIMVMLHPLMELFQIDASSYVDYIQDYLLLEPEENRYAGENLTLYEESAKIQIRMLLEAQGCDVRDVDVDADATGRIRHVRIRFGSASQLTDDAERALSGILGEKVRISYEVTGDNSLNR